MSDGETDQAYIDRLVNDLPAFGLLPFVAMEQSTGFIFNRIWAAIKRESLNVVAKGVSTPKDVDDIMKAGAGMPQGPFWHMDQVGLDVVLDIENHYAKENPHFPRARGSSCRSTSMPETSARRPAADSSTTRRIQPSRSDALTSGISAFTPGG